jgi:predicted N-formylglutamate amidohydrolase
MPKKAPHPFGVVVSCEHGGHRIPTPYRRLFRGREKVLASHRGWDPGALVLAKDMARALDAPLVATTVSRLLIECNRSPDHPRSFSEFTRGLSRDGKETLRSRYYHPHRGAVEAVVRSAIRTHGGVVHVGVHTFTPVLNGRTRTADIGLLYDPHRKTEVEFCDWWIISLARALPGLHVRRNYPYRGWSDGLTTTLRGKIAAKRYLGIELEVNQALVMSSSWRHTRSGIARSLSDLITG